MRTYLVLAVAAGIVALPFASVNARQELHSGPGILSVKSLPDGAFGYIDGKYAGTTPLAGQKLSGGRHTILVKLRGYLAVSDTVDVQPAESVTRQYALIPACSLSIASEPAGGSVYIVNVFQGVTPVVLDDLKAGRTGIAVSQRYFFTCFDTVELSPGRTTGITLRLKARPALLSVSVPDSDVEVYVNSRIVSCGSLRDTLIIPGEIEVGARQRSTGQGVSTSVVVVPNTSVRFSVQIRHVASNPFVYSLLFPGLGQWKAGARILGAGLGIAFTGALVCAMSAEKGRSSSLRDYYSTYASYQRSATSTDAAALRALSQEKYDNARSAIRMRNIGLWTVVGIYVLSAADAFFLDRREDAVLDIVENPLPGLSRGSSIDGGTTVIRLKVRL